MTSLHKSLPLGNAHIAHAWQYANAAAREAATGFVTADLYKLALQMDDKTYWMLTATTPIWTQVTNADSSNATSLSVDAIKSTSGTIAAGKVVYVAAECGVNVHVEEAKADSSSTMEAIGVTTQEITNLVAGKVQLIGPLPNAVDTSSWAVNDELYVSATAAGVLTNVRPVGAASLVQHVGIVCKVGSSDGIIGVCVDSPVKVPNLSEGKYWLGDSNGQPVEATPAAVPTVLHGEEEAQDDTTSGSWTQAFRYSPTLEVAKYLVQFYAEITSSSGSYRVHARAQIDDAITLAEVAYEPEAVGSNEWSSVGGSYFFDCTSAAVHNFDWDFYAEGATSQIRRKRFIVMKVLEG